MERASGIGHRAGGWARRRAPALGALVLGIGLLVIGRWAPGQMPPPGWSGGGGGGGGGAHAANHAENGSDELLVENLGTACPGGETGVSDGAGGLDCTAAGGVSGALVALETQTASASSSLDFTTDISAGTYQEFALEFINIVPATDRTNILLRFSTDGGSTFDSGNNYAWVGFRQSVAGSANNQGSNATSNFDLTVGAGASGVSSTASNGGLSGSMRLFLSADGTIRPQLTWRTTFVDGTANIAVMGDLSGVYLSTTAINRIRVIAVSGNITSGTVRLYGISN